MLLNARTMKIFWSFQTWPAILTNLATWVNSTGSTSANFNQFSFELWFPNPLPKASEAGNLASSDQLIKVFLNSLIWMKLTCILESSTRPKSRQSSLTWLWSAPPQLGKCLMLEKQLSKCTLWRFASNYSGELQEWQFCYSTFIGNITAKQDTHSCKKLPCQNEWPFKANLERPCA